MRGIRSFALCAVIGFGLSTIAAAAEAPAATHTASAIALHGEPKYSDGFDHFDYVNPNAPKGGTVRLQQPGTYDTLNPFVLRGAPHVIITQLFTYDTLMIPSGDEGATFYGLLAQSITYPDDYSWAEFTLRPTARWHDGKPITAEDVVFSVETFQKFGNPNIKSTVEDIAKAEVTGPRKVRFTFKQSGNRGVLLDVAPMPVIPKHYWQGKDFSLPIVTPPLSSGPYKIGAFDLGRSITYERVKDYWAKDLPAMRGRYNYDKMVYDFYRDQTVALEAFKAGQTDIRWETNSREWSQGYDWPTAKQGLVKKAVLKLDGGVLFAAYFFNLRNPKFQDARVREALAYAFDFAWINKNLNYGLFHRSLSYFGPNERSAYGNGLPSALELKFLEPFRGKVPERVFTQPVNLPDTDGTPEGLRKNLQIASQLLRQAGYSSKNGKLVNDKTGQPLGFEILVPAGIQQTMTSSWMANLKLLGIETKLRQMDSAQFQQRLKDFDFEVESFWITQVGTPGSEQRNRWGSQAADIKGSFNVMGIKNPVVDALIEDVVEAQDRATYIAALHALDRVLMWNFYCVPQIHGGNTLNIGYWDRFGRPDKEPLFGQAFTSVWWVDPAKDAQVIAARSGALPKTSNALAGGATAR